MLKTNLKIMLVDDDPILVEMHSALLELNNYSVLTAEDGAHGLDMLNKYYNDIGVVVSDITMPNIDGYEFCKQIKQNDNTKDIPVIFVSARSNLDEKMKGYEAGADDFITKPVNESELCKKISALLNIREQHNKLNKQANESQNIATQAMTFSSELGKIIDFYTQVMNTDNYNEVAKIYFETISSFNLISVIQIITPEKTISLSESGIVSPLEINVMDLARGKGQFTDYGARTIVNYNSFSMLVKNMPLGDSEKHSRTKDILGMIGNGLEAKIHQLNSETSNANKESIFLSLQDSINNIELSLTELQKDNAAAIDDMNNHIQEVIMAPDLTKNQRTNIQKIANAGLERSNDAFHKVISIGENLKNILNKFQLVLNSKPQRQEP